ncbi:TPA: HAD-IC family P-type ATPase, partial [Klebsiella michiganensis]
MSPSDIHYIAITTRLTCQLRFTGEGFMEIPPENNAKGLCEAEVQTRLAQYGYNEVSEQPPGQLRAVLKRLWGPIPWMLEIALVLEVALGKTTEPVIIAGWLAFSAILGGIQERRAQSALDLLRNRLSVNASVCRDGTWHRVPARELVPGDVIALTAGDLVPADCMIDEGTVDVDQAALTGESTAESHRKGDTLYSGSTVTRGKATGTVTATGARSYFGRTAELVRKASSASHLEQLLFTVVRYLVTIDAMLAVILAIVSLLRGEDLLPLVPFFLVLIIATVPVTMPAAFTVANAVEARRLANQGVLVTGLSAVQEAATMNVLCIDKTGTLTRNQQSVAGITALPGESEDEVLAWAAAACDETTQGPLEMAIFDALRRRGGILHVRDQFIPFDPATKRSEARVRSDHDGPSVHVILGSPMVVASFAEYPPEFTRIEHVMAASGARILAVATGTEGHIRIRGLLAFADALREDAETLVRDIRSLGIRIIMVTGDTVDTARVISRQVGLGDRFGDAAMDLQTPHHFDAFANFYPEDKFRLVRSLQETGCIVGMTGDGVNDAPALKQAEVGITVQAASDVAKAAAHVVLTHPGLDGVAAVVSGGRRVFRRMLTWTITKIARTVELAALLTIGSIATGFFVTPLIMISVIVVLNDVVTITLATDRAWVSSLPERWNVGEIARLGGVLAAGWLLLAFVILWFVLTRLQLPVPQIQALMFAYLMYTAQMTIYLSRTPGRCWSLRPGRLVVLATVGN